ncbi:MAG: glycyl-radical enzyme activating protein [Verrucomicrobiae bacterium]|nr:glycyl-radical enzyme activating protein [Verrucomicrobiae bacterium]
MNKGRIFDIQRFCIHDGPGIRTTVFFKGCPLRCIWCSNPESIDPNPQLSYLPDRCIGCGECFKVCKPNALTKDSGGKAVVNRARCTNCGDCAPVCDPKALEMVGRDVTVDEVLEVVMRDHDYYVRSGGGLTLSGGEPLFQPEFAEELLHAAKNRGLHCCVETSGYAPWPVFERLQPVVDLWLFDYKETAPALHAKFTGRELETILERLRQLHDAGAKILLRCPMIPQHNARRDHLDGIVALSRKLPKLVGVELLPYFDLWRAKLKRFGLTTSLPDTVKPPSREAVKAWNGYLRERGVPVVD